MFMITKTILIEDSQNDFIKNKTRRFNLSAFVRHYLEEWIRKENEEKID